MKDRVERFVILPFSLGCSSQSSVDVATATTHHHHPHKKPNPPIKRIQEEGGGGGGGGEGESSMHGEDTKMESPPRGNESEAVSPKDIHGNNNDISVGIFRFIRSFKSFSHSFFIRYGDSTEETEAEMEIGFPTDVKHVTHIGIDGTMTTFDVASTTPSSFPFGRFQLATV